MDPRLNPSLPQHPPLLHDIKPGAPAAASASATPAPLSQPAPTPPQPTSAAPQPMVKPVQPAATAQLPNSDNFKPQVVAAIPVQQPGHSSQGPGLKGASPAAITEDSADGSHLEKLLKSVSEHIKLPEEKPRPKAQLPSVKLPAVLPKQLLPMGVAIVIALTLAIIAVVTYKQDGQVPISTKSSQTSAY